MIIENKKVVSLTYELRVNDIQGEIVEKVDASDPLVFLFGAGNMLPDFEKNLEGLKSGDEFKFGLTSKQAYGDYVADYVMDLPVDIFNEKGEDNSSLLKIGNVIPMRDENNQVFNGKVLEVTESFVKLDFNHPMAGENLFFIGKICDIRTATEKELEHGHIHQDSCGGGCCH
jgi:FKBP-type peptidyl-prolyl cis-trans isomerase SlyD